MIKEASIKLDDSLFIIYNRISINPCNAHNRKEFLKYFCSLGTQAYSLHQTIFFSFARFDLSYDLA